MCPPVNGSREEVCPGRHMGRPLQIQLKPPSTPGGAGGDRAPPLPVYRGVQQRAVVPKAWPPPTKFRSEIWSAVIGIGPYGEKGKPHRPPWPAEQSICASGHKGWVGHAAEIIPKVSSNLGQSFNRGIAATAPFAQGSLWGRGMRIAASLRSSQ